MSIEYITTKEFEEVLYPAWAKGRSPDPDEVLYRLMTRIEENRKIIANDIIYGRSPVKTLSRLRLESEDAALWSQFQDEFKVGPTQPDCLVAVSGHLLTWRPKP
jgi:hypothetical protein